MRFRKGIVVAEVALSVLLVVGAGLTIRSFQGLLEEDPGFDTENLLFARFTLPAAEYEPVEATVFFDQLLAQTRSLSSVEGATLTSRPPLLWNDQNGRLHIEGRPPAASGPLCCLSSYVVVGDDFFEVMGLSPVQGRLLTSEDHQIDGPASIVIDEASAARWWPEEDPIGKRVSMAAEDAPWSTVVGVVASLTYDGPGEFWPTHYMSHNQTAVGASFITRSSYLAVRTSVDPRQVLPGIRGIVRGLDPNLAIAGTYTMEEIQDRALARPRFIMSVLSIFAGVALALGAIGIYGVMAYGVALRAGEIGIRRALGAGRRTVLAMVLGQGLILTGLGVALGLMGAMVGSRVMEGFLHEVSPTDPLTYLVVGVGVLAVALGATFPPARRAGGVDPLEALRAE
jgi:predicted permease